MNNDLKNVVAVVTGSSRGAGKGIALALGRHGCTVYITGRSQATGDSPLPGTIYETAEAVTAAGGKGIAVAVDHCDEAQVEALFNRVREEQGKLDILVNNAFFNHDLQHAPGNFWEKPLDLMKAWDVGLKGSYIASYYAAALFTEQKHGLIIFTSAPGARHYVFGPVYGVHKAGMDKLAADMAVDFKPFNVACVSIWMGALMTERMAAMREESPEHFEHLNEETMETPQFTGDIIWALYNDPTLMEMSGKTVIGAEMGVKYGIKDEGRQPPSCRDMYGASPAEQHPFVIRFD